MNRHHENHPDPEVRQKYADWKASNDNYRARSAGFKDHEHRAAVKKIEEERKKAPSAIDLLKRIGSNVAFNLSQKNTQVKVNGQKKFKGSGRGRRGS